VSAEQRRREVVVSVADSGIGISQPDQAKLFLEFQQVGDRRRSAQQGTGLGLALVKRLAELHGGMAWVESEVGKGSKFYISFPQAERATVPAPAGDGPLVMVVEDNDGAALLLSTNLSRAGYRVEIVKNGKSVVERALALRPSAITLDVMLPDTDGWEVLRALKAEPATSDIPVLVISVLDDRALGLAMGADDYMVKPIQRDNLLRFIERHGLDRGATRRLTLLAVDDDPATLALLKETLEPEFDVVTVSSGEAALSAARNNHPDLVILDLMMPGMNGFEVAAALKADRKTLDIPILVSTAKDLSRADKARLDAHVAAVLKKGDSSSELLAWLHSKHLAQGGAVN
jgi:DNA-binding response OmpR family regulator